MEIFKFEKSNEKKQYFHERGHFFEKSKKNILKRKKTCLGVDAEVPRRPDERHLK